MSEFEAAGKVVPLLETTSGSGSSSLPCSETATGFTFNLQAA